MYKKPQYYLLLLLFTTFCLSQNLKAQSIQDQLIGIWSFDYNTSVNNMKNKSKAHYNRMNSTVKNKFEIFFENKKITFNTNGNYSNQSGLGVRVNGFWELGNGNQNIILTDSDGKVMSYKVKELSSTSLVLKPNTDNNGNSMLSEWYFIKN